MIRSQSMQGLELIELCRGERGNALSAAFVEQLGQAFGAAQCRQGAHLIAIRAEGAHFSTGFDLSDFDTCPEAELQMRFVRVEMLLAQVWLARVPVAVFAHGRTWGAGADLFCAASERWAHADASFRFPGAQFGLVLGTRRLAARVGPDTARRWIETGAHIGAAEALAAGLVTRIAEPAEFADFVEHRPMRLDAFTRAAIYDASGGTREINDDLAHLVRSAARPGLKERIAAYRRSLPVKS